MKSSAVGPNKVKHGLEGLVAKRVDSRCRSRQTLQRVEVKASTTGGYAMPGGRVERPSTGATVALLPTIGERLVQVGDAMIGLDPVEREAFWQAAGLLEAEKPRLAVGLTRRSASGCVTAAYLPHNKPGSPQSNRR